MLISTLPYLLACCQIDSLQDCSASRGSEGLTVAVCLIFSILFSSAAHLCALSSRTDCGVINPTTITVEKKIGYLHSRVGIRPFWPWILGQVKCSLWLDCSVFIASPESNIGWILWCNSLALIHLPALCLLQQRRNVRPIFHLAVTCSNTTTDLSGFFGVQRLCPNDGVAITPT